MDGEGPAYPPKRTSCPSARVEAWPQRAEGVFWERVVALRQVCFSMEYEGCFIME
jgi:hypothetical protein